MNKQNNLAKSTKKSNWKLSNRSRARLKGVDPLLVKVAERALELSPFDFGITSGKRSAQEQNNLFQAGKSQLDGYILKSRHQSGKAIDFAVYDEDGHITWSFSYYEQVSWAFKQAAAEQGVAIVWGGDWESFRDGPHVELDKAIYP